MNPEQLRAYAADLIKGQATVVDYLAIFECAEDSPHVGCEISEDDASKVADLIQQAIVTAIWDGPRDPLGAAEYGRAVELCAAVVDAARDRDGGPTVAGGLLGQLHQLLDARAET